MARPQQASSIQSGEWGSKVALSCTPVRFPRVPLCPSRGEGGSKVALRSFLPAGVGGHRLRRRPAPFLPFIRQVKGGDSPNYTEPGEFGRVRGLPCSLPANSWTLLGGGARVREVARLGKGQLSLIPGGFGGHKVAPRPSGVEGQRSPSLPSGRWKGRGVAVLPLPRGVGVKMFPPTILAELPCLYIGVRGHGGFSEQASSFLFLIRGGRSKLQLAGGGKGGETDQRFGWVKGHPALLWEGVQRLPEGQPHPEGQRSRSKVSSGGGSKASLLSAGVRVNK